MTTRDPLRRWLLWLSAIAVAGTLTELAMLRHWHTRTELIPWVTLLGAGSVIAVALIATSARTLVVLRWVGLAVIVVGLIGVVVHLVSNYDAAPLDGVVGPRWETYGLARRLWEAATGGVGPAPTLAAASLLPTGAVMVLATVPEGTTYSPESPQSASAASRS